MAFRSWNDSNGRGRGRGGGNSNRENNWRARGRNANTGRGRPRERVEDTPEQAASKANYNIWKRIIKNQPRSNDFTTIDSLWTGALEILNDDDREWKQMLPRDLDSHEFYGREHINTLMSMKNHGNGAATFVELVRPFLQVITHHALVDCLAVDTFVGGLYNFIAGSNGSRLSRSSPEFVQA